MKPEHRGYRTVDGHVRLGSVIHGIGAEIEDEGGWIWSLVGVLDGTRGPAGAVDAVAGRHPEVPRERIAGALQDLWQAGFLEDAAAVPPPGLGIRDRERHRRGAELLRWIDLTPRAGPWELQERLRRSRVLLVGVGGTGGTAAQSLVAAGVGRLHLVDPDTVELSNLNRQQLYTERDVGRAKTDAAVARLREVNSDVTVTGERREVTGRDVLAGLLGTPCAYDLLVLTADRPPVLRRWANRACLAAGIPWTDGGYHGPVVSAGLHMPGSGACWECHRAGEVARRDLRLPPGADEEQASPRMDWNPANAVTAGLSGSLVAYAALTLLTGAPPVEPGFRFGMNLMLPGEELLDRFPRRADCPACGEPGPGRTGRGLRERAPEEPPASSAAPPEPA
ncbi:ThiF family adenylyltransferase [Streptomyces sp. JJ36]|uniref:HesA/MoeB/ThiF family protein n=1 Tax=Streptomyces sp. JJ36 TaxID=2736645 RepID=UPI001F3E76CA|nr:ThiF family adenylyltransferase [Streptomyces sp. JJ36]MCF6526530.1 ThiF family adenylyltransferase [Streptomyces sp. JJ36]